MKKLLLTITTMLCLSSGMMGISTQKAHAFDCIPSSSQKCYIIWKITCNSFCIGHSSSVIGWWATKAEGDTQISKELMGTDSGQDYNCVHGGTCTNLGDSYTSGSACVAAAHAAGDYFCNVFETCTGGVNGCM